MIDTSVLRGEALDILAKKGYKVEENLNVLTINDSIEIEGLLSDSNIETMHRTQGVDASWLAQIIIDQFEYATAEL